MALTIISNEEKADAVALLSKFWLERGMPQYDKNWALKYLESGHNKEIIGDEFFIFREEEQLVGIISLITYIGNVAEIRDMVIKEELRNKGYGKRMLEELIVIAKQRKLRKIYSLALTKCESFYSTMGFVSEGILKSHFKIGEDLFIMSKFLD